MREKTAQRRDARVGRALFLLQGLGIHPRLVAFVINDERRHVRQIDPGEQCGQMIEMAMLLHGDDQHCARARAPLAPFRKFAFDPLHLGPLEAFVSGREQLPVPVLLYL